MLYKCARSDLQAIPHLHREGVVRIQALEKPPQEAPDGPQPLAWEDGPCQSANSQQGSHIGPEIARAFTKGVDSSRHACSDFLYALDGKGDKVGDVDSGGVKTPGTGVRRAFQQASSASVKSRKKPRLLSTEGQISTGRVNLGNSSDNLHPLLKNPLNPNQPQLSSEPCSCATSTKRAPVQPVKIAQKLGGVASGLLDTRLRCGQRYGQRQHTCKLQG